MDHFSVSIAIVRHVIIALKKNVIIRRGESKEKMTNFRKVTIGL